MPDKGDGSSLSKSRPKSVAINVTKSTNNSRTRTSQNPRNQSTSSKGGVTLLGLGTVLFLVLFVPVEGPLYACLLPLILLFAMKDFLNIPIKIFMIILALLGVILGFQLINSMSGLGMY